MDRYISTSVVEELRQALGSDTVLTAQAVSERSAGGWGAAAPLRAKAVLRPRSTEEVAAALRICHAAGQSVVPHGGLTNVVRSAHSTQNDIVLSLERMKRIEHIDPLGRTVTVQAGVILQDLQSALAQHGLLFPLDLGAKGSCQIGGNIATNAGGVRVIRYGMTRQLVLGLEVVLADGTILSSLNQVIKDNAGYDLKQLFIGTEGTLGVITRAVLKLVEAPRSRQTAFIACSDFGQVTRLLKYADRQLAGRLSAFEVLWQDYYQLMTTPPSLYAAPLPGHYPYYILLEALGADPAADEDAFQVMLERAYTDSLIADAAIASGHSDLAWFWGIRESVDFILQVASPVFLFDVSLPINRMEEYTAQIRSELNAVWPDNRCYIFGHLGDGNLHLFVSCGEDDESTRHRVEEIVYTPLRALHGSISAEHGIGLEKKAWLHLSRSPAELACMQMLKMAFDPKGILNPGKIFD